MSSLSLNLAARHAARIDLGSGAADLRVHLRVDLPVLTAAVEDPVAALARNKGHAALVAHCARERQIPDCLVGQVAGAELHLCASSALAKEVHLVNGRRG